MGRIIHIALALIFALSPAFAVYTAAEEGVTKQQRSSVSTSEVRVSLT